MWDAYRPHGFQNMISDHKSLICPSTGKDYAKFFAAIPGGQACSSTCRRREDISHLY